MSQRDFHFCPREYEVTLTRRSLRKIGMTDDKKERSAAKGVHYQLFGWILFIACAILFIAASIVNWEPLVFAGSIIFLLACFIFMIPLLDSFRKNKKDT